MTGCEGSLTSLAKQVFFADIQMDVFNTDSAVLDMGLLLLPISKIVDRTLALMGHIVDHGEILGLIGRMSRASVYAMSGSREVGDRSQRGIHA